MFSIRPFRAMRIALVVAFATTVLLTSAPVSAASDASAGRDITHTARGQRIAHETARRFQAEGGRAAWRDLTVVERAGQVTVVPRGTTILADGSVLAAPRNDGAAQTPSSTRAAPYWASANNVCFARTGDSANYMDTCFNLMILRNDGDGAHDYWELHLYGTAHGQRLDGAWIKSYRSGGAAQSWVDWSPGQDLDGACRSISVGVTVLGIGASYGATSCEQWLMAKGDQNNARTFTVAWTDGGHFHCCNRQTAFVIAVKTPQGGSPAWGLDWNFSHFF